MKQEEAGYKATDLDNFLSEIKTGEWAPKND